MADSFFHEAAIVIFSLPRHQTKVPWSHWPMQFHDSSVNITFIQFSPHNDFFILACCYLDFLMFSCYHRFLFGLSVFKPHFIKSVSDSSVTDINSCFRPFIFHLLGRPFSFRKAYCFKAFYSEALMSSAVY